MQGGEAGGWRSACAVFSEDWSENSEVDFLRFGAVEIDGSVTGDGHEKVVGV